MREYFYFCTTHNTFLYTAGTTGYFLYGGETAGNQLPFNYQFNVVEVSGREEKGLVQAVFRGYALLSNARRVSPHPNASITVRGSGVMRVNGVAPGGKSQIISLANGCLVPNLVGLRIRLPTKNGPQGGPVGAGQLAGVTLSSNLSQTLILHVYRTCIVRNLLSNIAAIHTINNLSSLSAQLQSQVRTNGLSNPQVLTTGCTVNIPRNRVMNSIARPTRVIRSTIHVISRLRNRGISLVGLVVANNIVSTGIGNRPNQLVVRTSVVGTYYSHTRDCNLGITTRIRDPRKMHATILGNISSVRRNSALSRARLTTFRGDNTILIYALSPTLPVTGFRERALNVARTIRCGSGLICGGVILNTGTTLTSNIPINLKASANYPCAARCGV